MKENRVTLGQLFEDQLPVKVVMMMSWVSDGMHVCLRERHA